jgi:phosphinothricin acetyltransferase
MMQPEDTAKIIDIYQQGINGGNATYEKTAPTWEGWDSKYLKVCRFVLENEANEAVGWCALLPVGERACFKGVAEVSIYLDGSVQGKGLGKMLLKKLILDSEENGFWTLQAGIFPENEASIAIHEKLGFRVVGRRERLGELNGVWRDVVLLERRSAIVGSD